MRKWTAAVTVAAVLMAAGCKGKAQGAAGGGGANAGAAGSTASSGAPGAGTEETVPGGFTVDTQKVANPQGAGQSVNEPD